MREVHLGGKKAAGRVALVDDDDYDRVVQRSWFVAEPLVCGKLRGPYVVTGRLINAPATRLHILIMGRRYVDHINHNTLDNRKENLRLATVAQNMHNRVPNAGCKSPYKGVWWHPVNHNWIASISCNGKRRHLGCFRTDLAAAHAYDAAARELHGRFARPNFGPGGYFTEIPGGAVLLEPQVAAA